VLGVALGEENYPLFLQTKLSRSLISLHTVGNSFPMLASFSFGFICFVSTLLTGDGEGCEETESPPHFNEEVARIGLIEWRTR
jgi:hypothetical protein